MKMISKVLMVLLLVSSLIICSAQVIFAKNEAIRENITVTASKSVNTEMALLAAALMCVAGMLLFLIRHSK